MKTVGRVLTLATVTMLIASCAAPSPEVSVGRSTQRPIPTDPTTVTDPTSTSTSAPAPDNTGVPPSPARGIGDVLFPDLGNPGIDVTHYEVDLTYVPGANTLQATETLSIMATTDLAEFSLDSAGPRIASVTIGGEPVNFQEQSPELVITPTAMIAKGGTFDTTIVYSVAPEPAGSIDGLPAGWFPTGTGSYVINEPDGARTWLPSNDHPLDKATFGFTIHVPTGVTGVANGQLVDHSSSPTGETWTWSETDPMATYLIQVLTGKYSILNGSGPNGLPLTSAVLTADVPKMQPFIDALSPEIAFFENSFGPFPLQGYGIAITDSPPGLAMEEQGRSLFSREDFTSGHLGEAQQLLLSHELAHQWFGDAVSPAQWQDIWLNESFATYCEWMWMEHVGGNSLASEADAALARRQQGSISTGRPSADAIFGFQVYEGGAVVLHALRLTIGDANFFSLLRSWTQQNVGASRTSADFIALAEQVSARDLTSFFNDWLYATSLPAAFPAAVN